MLILSKTSAKDVFTHVAMRGEIFKSRGICNLILKAYINKNIAATGFVLY